MDALANVVLVSLAAAAAVHCWFKGSIFAGARDWVEFNHREWLISTDQPQPIGRRVVLFLAELLLCPYCLTFWVTAGLTLTQQPTLLDFLCRWWAAAALATAYNADLANGNVP